MAGGCRPGLPPHLGRLLPWRHRGYYELHRPDGENAEIRYFGLAPQFLDKGFGGPLLSQAIRSAWEWPGTRRVWVHTCSLDHPAALANYQARGLQLYKQEHEALG